MAMYTITHKLVHHAHTQFHGDAFVCCLTKRWYGNWIQTRRPHVCVLAHWCSYYCIYVFIEEEQRDDEDRAFSRETHTHTTHIIPYRAVRVVFADILTAGLIVREQCLSNGPRGAQTKYPWQPRRWCKSCVAASATTPSPIVNIILKGGGSGGSRNVVGCGVCVTNDVHKYVEKDGCGGICQQSDIDYIWELTTWCVNGFFELDFQKKRGKQNKSSFISI